MAEELFFSYDLFLRADLRYDLYHATDGIRLEDTCRHRHFLVEELHKGMVLNTVRNAGLLMHWQDISSTPNESTNTEQKTKKNKKVP